MSGKLTFIPSIDLDIDKYQACILQSESNNVYAQFWYLNAISGGNWGAVVLGDYQAVMPISYAKKWGLVHYVYQAFFCQQLGVFSANEKDLVIQDFLNAIPPKFKRVHVQIHNEIMNANLKLYKERTNYFLPLNKNYEQLQSKYNKDAKKNLKSCAHVQYADNIDVAVVIELNKDVWGNLNPGVKNQHYDNFLHACKIAKEKGALELIAARDGETLLGAAIFLNGGNRWHYACAAPTKAGRKVGVMHGILDHFIRSHADTKFILDFEGSDIPNVANLYKKFGAISEKYYEIKWR